MCPTVEVPGGEADLVQCLVGAGFNVPAVADFRGSSERTSGTHTSVIDARAP